MSYKKTTSFFYRVSTSLKEATFTTGEVGDREAVDPTLFLTTKAETLDPTMAKEASTTREAVSISRVAGEGSTTADPLLLSP